MKKVRIKPCMPIEGSIRPPGSKSLTNRALICAGLSVGTSQLSGALDSEDTRVMLRALQDLGVQTEHDLATECIRVVGSRGRFPVHTAELFMANSGTSIRFLTAALCTTHGSYHLDGLPRMRERPIADLLSALRQLGANVRSLNEDNPNCPPIIVEARGLAGGTTRVAGNISSQYLSGILLAAPMAESNVTVRVDGSLVSTPYIKMTIEVMKDFGAKVTMPDSESYLVDSDHRYQATDYAIEPDASAASYFWAAAAIAGGRARVEGLSQNSIQGDVGFCDVLGQMGCKVEYFGNAIEVEGAATLRGVDVDMSDISDTVQTLAAVALFAEGPTSIRGVAHNRVKETDRIRDLAIELRKLGARVDEASDGMTIFPPVDVIPSEIETYHDHRMAMSLALVGLRVPGISILDPDCTAKTYPNFWQDLAKFAQCGIVCD